MRGSDIGFPGSCTLDTPSSLGSGARHSPKNRVKAFLDDKADSSLGSGSHVEPVFEPALGYAAVGSDCQWNLHKHTHLVELPTWPSMTCWMLDMLPHLPCSSHCHRLLDRCELTCISCLYSNTSLFAFPVHHESVPSKGIAISVFLIEVFAFFLC